MSSSRENTATLNIGGFLVAGFALMATSLTSSQASLEGWLPALVSGPCAVALNGLAAWRDSRTWLKHAFVVALFALVPCLLTGSAVVIATLAAVLVGMVVWRDLLVRRGGPLPYSLLGVTQVPVYEFDGVHFTIQQPTTHAAGKSEPFVIVAENCWTGPRTLVVKFKTESGATSLRVPEVVTVGLGGGEAGRADFSIEAPAGASGPYTVLLHLEVRGWKGRRVRHRRAMEVRNAVSVGEQVAYAAGGAAVWGGGLRLRFSIS